MYGLRCINNMYSEHAGTRSDYIIVGHPEYQHGKIKSQSGFGNTWDTKVVAHPKKCLAGSRSHGKLVSELSCPEPWMPLKEKTIQRQMQKDPCGAPGFTPPGPGGLQRSSSAGGLQRDFNAFVQKLAAPEEEFQQGRTARTPLSLAKTRRQVQVCRHFAARHEEIDDLRKQMQQTPEATQRKLQESGAWKYYALQLEQDQRLKAQFSKDKQRLEPSVRRQHDLAASVLRRTA